MIRAGSSSPEDLYALYLAKLRQVRAAMAGRDGEALRLMELDFGSLTQEEQHVLAMAVHDVAAGRPRLAKTHFVRALRAEQAQAQRRGLRSGS